MVAADDAPEGKHYAVFSNETAGRGSLALQGFAVDGLKVPQLELSVMVRGRDIRPGQTARELPAIVISFYDENRATIGEVALGPWRGTFDWQRESKLFRVPRKAREAVLRIGLLGATGEIAFDDLKLGPAGK